MVFASAGARVGYLSQLLDLSRRHHPHAGSMAGAMDTCAAAPRLLLVQLLRARAFTVDDFQSSAAQRAVSVTSGLLLTLTALYCYRNTLKRQWDGSGGGPSAQPARNGGHQGEGVGDEVF